MRADFMGQALAYRPFADALQEASLLLGPMNRDELRAAIEKPAEAQGAAFEAGLVQRILDDVGQEPGNLPLLEFALTLLWERHSHGWLTHAGYEEIGGVAGALARYADEVYGGLDGGGAGRRAAGVCPTGAARRGDRGHPPPGGAGRGGRGELGLVQHLADKRLVVTGRDAAGAELVEVVHESLIQGWGQLRAWIEAGRAFRTWQERLRAALHQWEAAGRDEGAVLRGAPLVEAEGWLAERGGELSEAERAFILAGCRAAATGGGGAGGAAAAGAGAARDLAEERARAAGRLRRRAAWLALALVVALLAVGVAAGLWNRSANLASEKAAAASVAQAASTQSVQEAAAARAAQALEAEQRGTAEAEAEARATQQAIAETQAGLATSRELAAAAVNATARTPSWAFCWPSKRSRPATRWKRRMPCTPPCRGCTCCTPGPIRPCARVST